MDIKMWLCEQISGTREDAREAACGAPNSFGHGFEMGYPQALKHVLAEIEDIEALGEQQGGDQ